MSTDEKAVQPQHILGMEPDSVCRQMIRNHFAAQPPDRRIGVEDCIALMMEFNEYLVEMNQTLQKLALDKLGTTLPGPILQEAVNKELL